MWRFYFLFLTMSFSVVSSKNNVCPSDKDYLTIDVNPNCSNDPDVDYTIPEIINRYGFKSEFYNVTTWDGYILGMFRIPSKLNETDTTPKTPLLIFPGLLRDARCMFLLGQNSPAIYYANLGYDVWVVNRRGTEFSSHIKYSKDDPEFWFFSFNEMGEIDLPAFIDGIYNKTQQKMVLMGHSMGTTASFVYCTQNITHCANHLKNVISLAPIAKLNKAKTPLIHALSVLGNEIKVLLNVLDQYRIETQFFKICQVAPFTGICATVIEFFTGLSTPNIYPRVMPIYTAHGNTPVSVKNINHYGQIIKSGGEFKKYDYGPVENQLRYSSLIPPTYNVEDIPVHVTLIYANSDLLAYESDVIDLYNSLNPDRRSIVKIPSNGNATNLAHMDFFLAANIEEVLYPEINNALK